MNYIGRLIPKSVKEFYYEINSATLTGAIDVVVVEQADGSFLCSPFHVRFGKLGVLRSKEKIVDIEINGEPVDIHMKLGDTGEAFFVEEIDEDEDESLPSHLATSPFPGAVSSADYLAAQLEKLKISQEESDAKPMEDENGGNGGCDGNDQESEASNRVLQITSSPPSSEERMPNGEMIVCTEKNSTDDNGSEASPVTEDNYVSVADTVPNDANHDSTESTSPILAEEHFQPTQPTLRRGLISVGVQTTDLGNLEVEDYRNGGSGTLILAGTLVQQQKRRKRRKHSMNKRSINSRSKDNLSEISPYIANLNPTFSLDPMDDIFHMDDDWDDDSSTVVGESMTRSSSVPTPSFYANKLNTPKTQYSVSVSDFHPYSDGEVTPRGAATPERRGSLGRPSSPKSDTEFEITRRDATSQTDPGEVSWPWGELPQVFHKGATPRKNSPNAQGPASPQDEVTSRSEGTQSKGSQRKSVVGGILNFIKNKEEQSNKKSNAEDKGIYLDDLNPNSIDPEVAELYFPKLRSQVPLKKSVKDDDAESGNGPSLPHSPQCVSSGPQSIDSDSDQERTLYGICDYRKFYDVKLSLCGGMKQSGLQPPDRFEQFVVSYDEFRKNASNILQNPDLVIQIGGKYYSWRAAAPMIVSLVVFQQPLPDSVLGSLNDSSQQKKKTESRGSWWSWRRSHTVANSETLSINSSTEPTTSVTPTAITSTSTATTTNQESKEIGEGSAENADAGVANTSTSTPNLTTAVSAGTTADVATGSGDVTDRAVNVSAEELPLFQEENSYESSKMDERALSETEYVDDEIVAITANRYIRKNSSYKKTLRLSTEQIKSLSLKDGANEVVFSVTTAYQGTSRCMCHIYLWRHDDKIIISDIDGTITKSDVFGHILPMLGVDWAQSGVANLFTKINDNGYKLLYLSARAIGQARTTREYLKSVRQGEVCLPDGPLLLSPTSLISAFHREVIEKKPEEFKISCLRDIQTLFPTNPFYAGFGNKINDTWAYRAVGIPPSRIFTINHRGELKLELIQYFQSTYTSLSDVVDHMFPPVPRSFTKGSDFLSEYSSYMYWKEPITTIDCDDPFLKTLEAQASAAVATVPQPKKPVK